MIKRSSNRRRMTYYISVKIQSGESHEEKEEKEPEKEKNPIISACRTGLIDRCVGDIDTDQDIQTFLAYQ